MLIEIVLDVVNRHIREWTVQPETQYVSCAKKGHWKTVCRSKKVNEVLTDNDMEELFLGEVIDAVEANQLNLWKADIAINDKIIKFKIDSGADVSVLPYHVYNKLKKQTELELEPTNKVLLGPCNYKLNCIGKFKAKLSATTRNQLIMRYLSPKTTVKQTSKSEFKPN